MTASRQLASPNFLICLLSLVFSLALTLCPSVANHSHTVLLPHLGALYADVLEVVCCRLCSNVGGGSLSSLWPGWLSFPPECFHVVFVLRFPASCICPGVFTLSLAVTLRTFSSSAFSLSLDYTPQGEGRSCPHYYSVVSGTAISPPGSDWLSLSQNLMMTVILSLTAHVGGGELGRNV